MAHAEKFRYQAYRYLRGSGLTPDYSLGAALSRCEDLYQIAKTEALFNSVLSAPFARGK